MVIADNDPDTALVVYSYGPIALCLGAGRCWWCGFAVISLSIALGFALLGYWLILPFVGLNLAGLALALYIFGSRIENFVAVGTTNLLKQKLTTTKGE